MSIDYFDSAPGGKQSQTEIPKALKEFASRLSGEGVVLFAGAGISAGAPSCLPSWFDLNEQILKALYSRASRGLGVPDEYSTILRAYRNKSRSFPSDFQAQFLEECAGTLYFEAFAAIDIDYTNRGHNAIAALAKSGSLSAIVTSSVDRLIEQALEKAGVPFSVVCDRKGFADLNEEWQTNRPEDLPVIKIHGSTDVIDSLIDTRKQRRRGRAEVLNELLASLLNRYPFLFAGFSGADFDHDPQYLGIWDAAQNSPGFCFMYQPGHPPRQAVVKLQNHYGAKAKLVEIDATQALEYYALARGVPPELVPDDEGSDPTQVLVQDGIRDWADRLNKWQAVRMIAALQKAAGLPANALRILEFGVQAKPDDTTEYTLMLADWVKERLNLARYDDIELRTAIRRLVNLDHPLGSYYQFLVDAFVMSHITGANAYINQCREFALEHETLLADVSPTISVDAVLVVCQVASLYGEFPQLMKALRFACDLSEQDGDEVRLAATRAELAIRLALSKEIDEAESLVKGALAFAKVFHERRVTATAMYADALIREQRGQYGKAIGSGHMSYEQAAWDELRLCMSRALLLQLRLACRYGSEENVNMVRHQINQGTGHEFWAHELERQLYEAEFAKRNNDPKAPERLATLADRARGVAMDLIAAEAEKLLK